MAAAKPLSNASDKWVRRSSVASPDYAAGVTNPRRDWAEASSAADQNYRQGVTAAAQAGRYKAGVLKSGSDKWKKGAIEKGTNRFAEGVSLARDEWEKGFAPYHAAIESLQLPARGPKGSPQNMQRVTAVTQAMRALFEKSSK